MCKYSFAISITMNQEILYRIALIQLPGIGDLFAKLLTEYFKGARNIFSASKKELQEIPGVGRVLLSTLMDNQVKSDALKRAEKELNFIQRHQISIWCYDDEHYPQKLKDCQDGPFILYYKGSPALKNQKIVSIVGARKATGYGDDMTQKIIEDLKEQDVLIVSGLAYGIDAFAHKYALENNVPTIGVLAHGLDKIYPQQNRHLAKNMLENGGLLTDFMSETNPDRENFPKRNRIVAGIADATILVEAATKGGALITANIAHSYGRDVFAVPGRTIDIYSAGCNALIKSNKAALIESGDDVLQAMNWVESNKSMPQKQLNLFSELNDEERKIIEIIQSKGVSNKEQLAIQMNQTVQKVSGLLFSLELNGAIKALPGNNFQIKA